MPEFKRRDAEARRRKEILLCVSASLRLCVLFIAIFFTGTLKIKAQLVIAAASDLRFALDDLVAEFCEEQPSSMVKPIYGSSGNFFAQIMNDAPFDLYLSAD